MHAALRDESRGRRSIGEPRERWWGVYRGTEVPRRVPCKAACRWQHDQPALRYVRLEQREEIGDDETALRVARPEHDRPRSGAALLRRAVQLEVRRRRLRAHQGGRADDRLEPHDRPERAHAAELARLHRRRRRRGDRRQDDEGRWEAADADDDDGERGHVRDPLRSDGRREEDVDQRRPAMFTFCWDELPTIDLAAATAFYEASLGWKPQTADMGGGMEYTLFKRPGDPDPAMPNEDRNAGGAMTAQPGQSYSYWLSYVAVPSADVTVAQVKRLGGTVMVEPMDIPNVGRFAVFSDPQKATLAVLQPAT